MTIAELGRTNSGELLFQNPQWTPIDTIRVEVLINGEWHDYHCTDYDGERHGQELWKLLNTTYVNQVAACSDEERYEWAARDIEANRAVALKETDWMACSDVELENQSEWLAYRREWRNITETEGFPFTVELPKKPKLTKCRNGY